MGDAGRATLGEAAKGSAADAEGVILGLAVLQAVAETRIAAGLDNDGEATTARVAFLIAEQARAFTRDMEPAARLSWLKTAALARRRIQRVAPKMPLVARGDFF